jgi:hypothetical protein
MKIDTPFCIQTVTKSILREVQKFNLLFIFICLTFNYYKHKVSVQ